MISRQFDHGCASYGLVSVSGVLRRVTIRGAIKLAKRTFRKLQTSVTLQLFANDSHIEKFFGITLALFPIRWVDRQTTPKQCSVDYSASDCVRPMGNLVEARKGMEICPHLEITEQAYATANVKGVAGHSPTGPSSWSPLNKGHARLTNNNDRKNNKVGITYQELAGLITFAIKRSKSTGTLLFVKQVVNWSTAGTYPRWKPVQAHSPGYHRRCTSKQIPMQNRSSRS